MRMQAAMGWSTLPATAAAQSPLLQAPSNTNPTPADSRLSGSGTSSENDSESSAALSSGTESQDGLPSADVRTLQNRVAALESFSPMLNALNLWYAQHVTVSRSIRYLLFVRYTDVTAGRSTLKFEE
jgi:hypothetical protein